MSELPTRPAADNQQKRKTNTRSLVQRVAGFTIAAARFPKNGGGWGYAVFNYDAPSGKFSPDAKSLSDCGNACHTAVKAKDYIFHPYDTR